MIIRTLLERKRRLRWLPGTSAAELNMDMKSKMLRLLGWLALLFATHVAAMVSLEGMGLWQAIWLTFTTLATVGYGDTSASTPAGQTATMVLMYAVGITLMAQLASDYIDFRIERRRQMLKGEWEWKMEDHLLIINTPRHNSHAYCLRLVEQLRNTPSFRDLPVQLLTCEFPDGLPQQLRDYEVVHHHDDADTDRALEAVHVAKARYVVILAGDHHDRRSDAISFDILHRVFERIDPQRTHVVAECVDDHNRARFRKVGAQSVIRPIRAYPELVVRALVAPGVESMLENLFKHDDDHSLRFDLPIKGLTWAEVVTALIRENMGTAMAFLEQDGTVNCNPPAQSKIDAKALIVMVRSGEEPSTAEVRRVLQAAGNNAT